MRSRQTQYISRREIYYRTLAAGAIALAASVPVSAGATEPVVPQAPAPQVNAVAQAAINAGAVSCASRINQVSQFISDGSKVGAFFFAPPAQPDQRLLSYSFEIQPPNGLTVYASASFAPNQTNGCGAEYEAVMYWPQSCERVASKQFSEAKKGRLLNKSIQVLELQGAGRIFLMPAGSGCVSIKKEVVL